MPSPTPSVLSPIHPAAPTPAGSNAEKVCRPHVRRETAIRQQPLRVTGLLTYQAVSPDRTKKVGFGAPPSPGRGPRRSPSPLGPGDTGSGLHRRAPDAALRGVTAKRVQFRSLATRKAPCSRVREGTTGTSRDPFTVLPLLVDKAEQPVVHHHFQLARRHQSGHTTPPETAVNDDTLPQDPPPVPRPAGPALRLRPTTLPAGTVTGRHPASAASRHYGLPRELLQPHGRLAPSTAAPSTRFNRDQTEPSTTSPANCPNALTGPGRACQTARKASCTGGAAGTRPTPAVFGTPSDFPAAPSPLPFPMRQAGRHG